MTAHYLALVFYVTVLLAVKFLFIMYTRRTKEKNALLEDNAIKVKTGNKTIQNILQYSREQTPLYIKGKYDKIGMN